MSTYKEPLSITHPHLADEWHHTKNGNLTPADVTAGSGKKMWWLLPYDDPKTGKHFDFEWQAVISNRVNGTGCPYLLGRAIWKGFNDFATTHPELAAQWHPTKNGDLTPEDITAGSQKKVWWYLPYDDPITGKHFDFEWQETAVNRKKGNNCPYLSGQAIWKGFNDLATTHPELAAQWHPTKNGTLTPNDVTAGSNKKVWWIFPYDDPATGKHFDFEWQTTIVDRVAGSNCPFLVGNAIWRGFNDLATTHPELAKEWHPTKNENLTPHDVTSCSGKEFWWIFPYDDPATGKHFDFEWKATVSNRIAGQGCPYLSGKAVRVGFNDLATTHSDLTKEWHPTKNTNLTPNDVTAGSNKKVWWQCSVCGCEWCAKIGSRKKGSGCPRCSESKGEKTVAAILNKHNINFIREYSFSDCRYKRPLRFDFALHNEINSLKLLIEVDGEQHYKPITFTENSNACKEFEEAKIRDKIKTQYCKENGISLIRIPYWKFDNIEKIILKKLFRCGLIHADSDCVKSAA